MPPNDIIDSAVCLPAVQGVLQADAWLALAERWGIRHSIAAPTDEFVAVYNDEGNAQLAETVRRHPERLSALAVANPWYGPRAVETLRRAFDLGFVGLYLHPGRQGFHLTDSILDPLIQLCVERGKPVYAYPGTPICAMPLQLAELARRFPAATFVMGHMAWSDFCGYDVIPAARQADNIVLETSCSTSGMVKLAIDAVGPRRVLFGSGFPRSRPSHEFEKLKHLALPPDQLDLYLHENARRVWKLSKNP